MFAPRWVVGALVRPLYVDVLVRLDTTPLVRRGMFEEGTLPDGTPRFRGSDPEEGTLVVREEVEEDGAAPGAGAGAGADKRRPHSVQNFPGVPRVPQDPQFIFAFSLDFNG